MRRWILLSLGALLIVGCLAPAASAQFSINCKRSHSLMDDPIVFGGSPGASHLHEFFGNRSTNAFSTYATMVASTSTCRFSKDTAGYWAPAMLIDGTVVEPVSINAYYRPPNQFVDPKAVVAFPPDFRMVAGGDTIAAPSVAYWSCDDQAVTRTPLPGACPLNKTVHANVSFPSCWDGESLDAFDHRSHVAYPAVDGGCPDTHPIMVPRVTVIVRYGIRDATGAMLSSGLPTSLHADFWNTWQQDALVAQVDRCIHVKRNCVGLRG